MFKDSVIVLDVCSSKLILSVCKRGVNGTFVPLYTKTSKIYTYYEREFNDVKKIETAIFNLFDEIKQIDLSRNTVYVSVPADFIKTYTRNFKLTFGSEKKITSNDVITLYNSAYDYKDSEYSLINRSACYYLLGNNKCANPIGKKAEVLGGRLSFQLASNYFMREFSEILAKLSITKLRFISSPYAECAYLFNDDERGVGRTLIDVGYCSTSISIVVGDGLLYSASVPCGSGIISANLQSKFGSEFEIAEELRKRLNLGLKSNYDKYYEFEYKNSNYSFLREDCNAIAKGVIDNIAEQIDNAILKCKLVLPMDMETCFTGGGVSTIRGATEYLADRLGKYPIIVSPKVPKYEKPYYSSYLALIDAALKLKNDKIFFYIKEGD